VLGFRGKRPAEQVFSGSAGESPGKYAEGRSAFDVDGVGPCKRSPPRPQMPPDASRAFSSRQRPCIFVRLGYIQGDFSIPEHGVTPWLSRNCNRRGDPPSRKVPLPAKPLPWPTTAGSTCLLNILRCTLPDAREIKPADAPAAKHLLAALDSSRELYLRTGRKLVVADFANILLAILAPTARRLMCDISPCGGGRCFFALAPGGDLFPCSEFIGLPRFRGGNLFEDDLPAVLASEPFRQVTDRKVEDIEPCRRCAIRHFCGSPCPAEAHEMNGGMCRTGAFCEFYEQQVRYALRAIADGRQDDYLWAGWDQGTRETFALS
jgi:radical SAM protein with 4Fe4S-binding SPASM domain